MSCPAFDGHSDTDLTNRYLWGPVVDQILADEQVASLGSPGDVIWPLTDHLGTARDLAEYNAGTDTTSITNHRIYDSFGNLVSETNAAVDALFGFTGRPYDDATDLQNNLNRWYDPVLHQWLSEDPLGLGPDENPRRYVGNDPVNFTDSTGLAVDRVPDGKGGYIVRYIPESYWGRNQYDQAIEIGRMATASSEVVLHTTRDSLSFINGYSLPYNRLASIGAENRVMDFADQLYGVLKNVPRPTTSEVAYGYTAAVGQGLKTGAKAGVNSTADTVVGFVTLGTVDNVQVWKVDKLDEELGYNTSYMVQRVAKEVLVGVATGGAGHLGKAGKVVTAIDVAGNAMNAGRGAVGVVQEGELNWENGTRLVGGTLGLGANAVGAYSKAAQAVPVTGVQSRAKSGWINFWDDVGGETIPIDYGAKYTGKLSWADRLGLKQGYSTVVRNDDVGGSWFARMDTAVHEGFHALVGKHLPSVWDAGDATFLTIPVGAPIKYVEEVFAYAVGHGGAFRFHAIPLAPIEAFGSLSPKESITTIVFGLGAYMIYEYFND